MSTSAILLERMGALIQQSVRNDAARHGLLPIHVQVLHYLAVCNRYSDLPVAIADYFGVTRGTVSQTLAVLERKGLVGPTPTWTPVASSAGRAAATVGPSGWTRRYADCPGVRRAWTRACARCWRRCSGSMASGPSASAVSAPTFTAKSRAPAAA
jgi:hypothetical protein